MSTAQLSVSKAEFRLPWRVGKHTSCISISCRKIDLCLTRGGGNSDRLPVCTPCADLFLIRSIETSWRLAYLSLACEHLMMLFIDFQGCQSCASVREPNAGTKSDQSGVERQRERVESMGGRGDWRKLKELKVRVMKIGFVEGKTGTNWKKKIRKGKQWNSLPLHALLRRADE